MRVAVIALIVGSILFSSFFLWRSGVLPGILAGVLAVSGYLPNHTVVSIAMDPNFRKDQEWGLEKYSQRDLQRGDVVLFSPPEEFRSNPGAQQIWLRRVVGLPGETVLINEGKVYANGVLLDESSYLAPNVLTYDGAFTRKNGEVFTPQDAYFLMGDNRPYSTDSREFGPIQRKNIFFEVTTCRKNCR